MLGESSPGLAATHNFPPFSAICGADARLLFLIELYSHPSPLPASFFRPLVSRSLFLFLWARFPRYTSSPRSLDDLAVKVSFYVLFRYLAIIPMRDSCDLPMTITADAKRILHVPFLLLTIFTFFPLLIDHGWSCFLFRPCLLCRIGSGVSFWSVSSHANKMHEIYEQTHEHHADDQSSAFLLDLLPTALIHFCWIVACHGEFSIKHAQVPT